MEEIFQTTELSDERITSRRPELAENSFVLIRAFINWQLETSNLNYCLFLPRGKIFGGRLKSNKQSPSVCSVPELIQEKMKDLVHVSNDGYSAIYSSNNTTEEIIEFFSEFHFTVVRSNDSSLYKSCVFDAAFRKQQLQTMLLEACSLGGKSFCCFAHDADPIYLISNSQK